MHSGKKRRIQPRKAKTMKNFKRIAALLLIASLLLTLSACSPKPAQLGENTQVITNAGTDNTGNNGETATSSASMGEPSKDDTSEGMTCYSDACDFYSGLLTEMANIGGTYISRNNAEIEEHDPENYLTYPQYLDLSYMPFVSVDMALTSGINDSTDAETVREIFEGYGFENVEFTVTAPGQYRITFEDEAENGDKQYHEVLMRYESGSIRFETRINGAVTEFIEFIAMGGGYFALQNMTDRAIVLYRDGKLISLYHSTLRYEMVWDENRPTSWSVTYDSNADSIWGRNDLNRSWVDEKNASDGIHLLFEFADDTFVVSGYRKIGYGEEAEFVPMNAIAIR